MKPSDRVCAAFAVGAVALAWPASAQAPSAREEIVEVSAGLRSEFTRLTFAWKSNVSVNVSQDGAILDLRFSRPGDPVLADLRVSPPKYLRAIRRISRPGQPLLVRLELDARVKARHFSEGKDVVIDLLKPEAEEIAPQSIEPVKPAEASADPVPKGGTVSVRAAQSDGAATFTLRWPKPAKAAAFRRGEGIYFLFDSQAKLDISGIAKGGAVYSDVHEVRGEGYVGLRFAARPEIQVSAESDGTTWVFQLGESVDPPETFATQRRETLTTGFARLAAEFGREGVVRWIEDPEIGDRFAAALLTGPAIGLSSRNVTLEAALLPAAHGAVIETRADGVGASFVGNALIVSRGVGLVVANGSEEALPRSEGDELTQLDGASFRKMTASLERAAAAELDQDGESVDAHLALARHLLSFELAPEALGTLRSALAALPEVQNDPQFRLLRGIANAMMGRTSEANQDLEFGGLRTDAAASLWRGYVAARAEVWGDARRSLEKGRAALNDQPRAWRARLRYALTESALQLGDLAGAEEALTEAQAEAEGPEMQEEGKLLRARLQAAKGEFPAALGALDQLAQSRLNEVVAVRSKLEAIKVRRALGQTPEDAIEQLEQLRFRWRGDELELEIIATLGHIYTDRNQWREGLSVMHAGSARFPKLPAGRRLRQDLAAIFERLYLEGEADKLAPIQALALFYEFKDLTPVGAQGDAMIRKLAARLSKVDLLEQAAALLQHQVDNRLRGLAKAQIALDLAAIYLADGKSEKALGAIDLSRQPNLPPALVNERRIVQAKALIDLGRLDHAEELVERDPGPEAARIRAEVAWRQRDWLKASAALREILPPSGRDAPLDDDARRVILRLAAAYVFASDEAGSIGLRKAYGAKMASTPDSEAFDVLTLSPQLSDIRLRNVVREVGNSDLISRFLQRLRERGGGPESAKA
jgi:hypothetical protein